MTYIYMGGFQAAEVKSSLSWEKDGLWGFVWSFFKKKKKTLEKTGSRRSKNRLTFSSLYLSCPSISVQLRYVYLLS